MSEPATVALTAALIIVIAVLAAACADTLSRLNGATYPTALIQSAAAFTAVLTLAAAVTTALTPYLR
ncbi:hypothetical protein ACFYVK_39805 [Streptomyces chartreusis]|uniref:hypothetical protein n=1 Tax=Streptomyces chartreusis TaxID=1969 RepID=UPI0036C367D0